MKEKNECVKAISNSLEKILNDIIELFGYLKVSNETKIGELEALLFSKKRIIEITENCALIFQNLVFLKHIHRNSTLSHKERSCSGGFQALKDLYNARLNLN